MREVKATHYILVLLVSITTLAVQAPHSAHPTNRPLPRSLSAVPPDTTFRRAATVGEALIFALPDTLAGRTDVRYDMLRAPAMSWLVNGSFFWRPRTASTGPHTLHFRAHYLGRHPPDTVAVMVKVTTAD